MVWRRSSRRTRTSSASLVSSGLREAELRLAQATKTLDFTIGAGVRRFEETGDNALVLSFSVPLPIANRNAGAIAESQARIAALPYQREAALLEIRTRLFALYQELQQTRTEATALDTELVPLAREALEPDPRWF